MWDNEFNAFKWRKTVQDHQIHHKEAHLAAMKSKIAVVSMFAIAAMALATSTLAAQPITRFQADKLPAAFKWIGRIPFGANDREFISTFGGNCDKDGCLADNLSRECLSGIKTPCKSMSASYTKDMAMDHISASYQKNSPELMEFAVKARAEYGDGKTVTNDMRPAMPLVTTSTTWKIPGGTINIGNTRGVNMQGSPFETYIVSITRHAK